MLFSPRADVLSVICAVTSLRPYPTMTLVMGQRQEEVTLLNTRPCYNSARDTHFLALRRKEAAERGVTLANQYRNDLLNRSVEVGQLIDNITTTVFYLTLATGYLSSIITSAHLTVLNFLLFTILRCIYCLIAWFLLKKDNLSPGKIFLGLVSLTVVAILSGLLSTTGLRWDWLIYLTTLVTYMIHLPLRRAILGCALLWLAVWANVYLINHLDWLQGASDALTIIPGFIFVGAFMSIFRRLIAQRERAEELLCQLEASKTELEEAHKQLRTYADEVEELTVVRERTRLAREIHDSLGHYLSIVNIQLETISKLQEHDPARLASEIAEARRVASQAMQEVRNAVAALRPSSIATLSLTEALTQLGREFERNAQEIELTLDLESEFPPLSLDLQVALYRTLQEALTNVRKHARASKVLVCLRYEEELLELVVRDNGEGVSNEESDQQSGGFGLVGLRERIELLGGQIRFGPVSPSGYRVTIQVKVPTATDPGLSPKGECI